MLNKALVPDRSYTVYLQVIILKHKTKKMQRSKTQMFLSCSLSAGNDVPDVDCLNLAGVSAVPLDVPMEVLNAAKYPCQRAAGHGALREFIEHILLLKKRADSQKEKDDC